MLIIQDIGSIRLLRMNHDNRYNLFSDELEAAVKSALYNADNDDEIRSIVIYGGEGRSFSSGTDLNRVRSASDNEEMENWTERLINLYNFILSINKPVLAAVDGYAIGMGFQFAMMLDQRVISDQAYFIMSELKHDVGRSVGSAILGVTHGHQVMEQVIAEGEILCAERCFELGLASEITTRDNLLEVALREARLMSAPDSCAMINTKKFIKKRFLSILETARKESLPVGADIPATADISK